RAGAVLRGDPGGGHGHRRIERVLGGRWRGQPAGREAIRAGGRVRPPLHRPRRLARVPRGPGSPRGEGPGGRGVTKRRPISAANWKMHKTHLEAIRDVQKLSYLLDRADADRVEVVICPAFTALRAVQTLIDSDRLPYGLGAQNVHQEERGAFPGEGWPRMLRALKCACGIVGHAEGGPLFGGTAGGGK